VTRERFGRFDAVASLGAFEHFCSPEDYRAARQEDIYRRFFERVSSVLPDTGRFYLQTMVFGQNMIDVQEIDLRAPRESDAWYLAMMGAAFPGSFLPFGQEQIIRCADPHFRLVSAESGRLDYIEIIRQWDMRTESWNPRMALLKLRLLPRWLTSLDFRFAYTSGVSSNSVARAGSAGPLSARAREGVRCRGGWPEQMREEVRATFEIRVRKRPEWEYSGR
jgi:cyclopropane-fatty-acyl-phospholipid synthase